MISKPTKEPMTTPIKDCMDRVVDEELLHSEPVQAAEEFRPSPEVVG